MFTTCLNTPLGFLEIKGTEEAITSVLFVENEVVSDSTTSTVVEQCRKELDEYFAGTRQDFTVNTEPEGTDFQKQVWQQLLQIPFGDTASYGEIAKRMNKDERSSRAVGSANGQNPVAIIIPCHRVIGENGKLTGYAGGVWRKDWLLEHEGKVSGKRLPLF